MLYIRSDNHVWERDEKGIYFCVNCGLPQKPEGITKPPPPCKKRELKVYFEEDNNLREDN